MFQTRFIVPSIAFFFAAIVTMILLIAALNTEESRSIGVVKFTVWGLSLVAGCATVL